MAEFQKSQSLEDSLLSHPMIRLAVGLVLALTALGGGGCDMAKTSKPLSPSGTVKTYFYALQKGDIATIKSIMLEAEEISPLAVGMARQLAAKRGTLSCTETVKGDKALVQGTFENDEVINASLVQVQGVWKIDLLINGELVPDEVFQQAAENRNSSQAESSDNGTAPKTDDAQPTTP